MKFILTLQQINNIWYFLQKAKYGENNISVALSLSELFKLSDVSK